MKCYPHLFLAGTFDGLHAGHRRLLVEAFRVGEKVTIGITSDEFVKKYKRQTANGKLKTFQRRKNGLEQWLRENNNHASIIPIDDPYEPAASMKNLDALIVTKENRATGERINALRYALGVSPLVLIEVPIVPAEDGKPISSTRLRTGEIDSNGRLIMPESMRGALGKPMGRVLTETEVDRLLRSHPARQGETFIVTVGDIATKTFLDAGIIPKLAIIDGMVGRKPFHETLKILQLQKVKPFRFKGVKSGPGYISKQAMQAIKKMPRVIFIDGEEDLLVLPAILHAPLGSILYYGQPGEGLVEVVVTERKKQQVLALLGKFT